jgi:hypothetical protein
MLFIWVQTSCSDSSDTIEEVIEVEIESKPAMEGIRLVWDYSSLKQISDKDNRDYNGYARLIQLNDGSLLCSYESAGNIVVKKSYDFGLSWSSIIEVVKKVEGINMATPDILQLNDNSILLCYNSRPTAEADFSKKFSIKTLKSYDGGLSWKQERLVYEASSNFENGCWEPSAIQLPNSEIQLFFSNENVYENSNEQNISLCRSVDGGVTWSSEPEIVSFRAGHRDGMPSPILLNNKNEIIFSIEDNGLNNQFKPFTIRNSLAENWQETVDANSMKRAYALEEELNAAVYAGAPYIQQLSSGETLMSYQGTENKLSNDINNADMKVVIGNEEAHNFNRKSVPFLIASGKSALWNSIAVLNDDTIIALTTTNEFSSSNSSQVWMIKGYVLPEIEVANESGVIDGEKIEEIWKKESPIFIGQNGNTQMHANFTYDSTYLYMYVQVTDSQIVTNEFVEQSDGFNLYLDPKNKHKIAPGVLVFKLSFGQSSTIDKYEGVNKIWKLQSSTNVVTHNVPTSN